MTHDKIVDGEAMSSPTSIFLDAVDALGGPVEAMAILDLTMDDFAQLISGGRLPDREFALKVEAVTRGKIKAVDLFPAHDLEAAFVEFQEAFKLAVDKPCVRNWRAAVNACDRFQLVASIQ